MIVKYGQTLGFNSAIASQTSLEQSLSPGFAGDQHLSAYFGGVSLNALSVIQLPQLRAPDATLSLITRRPPYQRRPTRQLDENESLESGQHYMYMYL